MVPKVRNTPISHAANTTGDVDRSANDPVDLYPPSYVETI